MLADARDATRLSTVPINGAATRFSTELDNIDRVFPTELEINFFRVIQETRPTLLIDEADTFLQGNDELRGILNAGYTRDTAFVVRGTQIENPKGIPSFSPGLRGTSYPGFQAAEIHNPERVVADSSATLGTSRSNRRKEALLHFCSGF